ncbi:MAG: MarR family winged helix-turn-helix transcriptional regulator [Sphaerochaetaceae bacterium]|jgi:DNA-binding MarR family transcriptional regulator
MEKREIREMLLQVEHTRKRLLQPFFSELGFALGQGQPRILVLLSERDGITQRELSDATGIETTTLSRTLDRMEEAGFVVREPHPDSRRACLVKITELGSRQAEKVRKGFAVVDGLIWEDFSNQEMADFLSSLKRIKANLDACESIVIP